MPGEQPVPPGSPARLRPRPRWLVVSVHDVAPEHTRALQRLLRDLDAFGVGPRVFKVVPNSAVGGRLDAAPALVDLLRQEVRTGSEIVLHGYTHRAAGRLRGPWPDRLRARLFAGGVAEFLTLERRAMVERLEAGRELLSGLGLETRGFCAPGWLAPPEIVPLLRQLGFRYYVGMSTLRDLRDDRCLWLPWVGYMGASPWQERLVGVGGQAQVAVARWFPAVKGFLHPQGIPEAQAYQRVLRLLARLARERQPATYGQLLGS